MRRLALGIVVIVVAMTSAIAGPTDQDRVEKARTAVLTDDYQKDLPGDESVGNGSGSGITMRRPELRDDRSRIDTRDQQRDQDGPMSGVFSFLLWGVVIVGVALLAFWIASELVKYGGDDASLAEAPQDEATVDLAVIERPLGDAEELANRGEYREAIHALLLRTLQELVRSASVRVAPAMTSREILGRVPLLADARDALAGLITAVEITHFGGDEATVEDYQRCRAQFQKFATAFRASSARASEGSGTALGAA